MRLSDLATFAAYLGVVVAIGILARTRSRNNEEYFVAGRSVHWGPVGLSIMVTAFSSLNFMAYGGEVIGNGLYVLASLPAFLIVALPITRVFMPFLLERRVTSAYEYLEERFDNRVRRFAALTFLLWRVAWIGLTLFAASSMLSLLTGVRVEVLLVITGIAAATYTAIGGMRAVVWTDVAQFVVLVGGLAVCMVVTGQRATDGLMGVLRSAYEGGRLAPFAPFDPTFVSVDPRMRITVWSGLVGTFVAFLARYGADQMVLQRYFAVRSLRHARIGFWLNIGAALTALLLLTLFGLVAFAHAVDSGTLGQQGMTPPQLLVNLITSMPGGFAGLLGAAILAAAMSSVDSGVHSCATVFLKDLSSVDRNPTSPNGKQSLWVRPQVVSALFGIAAVAGGLLFVSVFGREASLFAITNKVINGLGSPLLSVFLFAMFTTTVTATAVLTGGAAGVASAILLPALSIDMALHYYAVVNLLVSIVVSLAVNAVTKENRLQSHRR